MPFHTYPEAQKDFPVINISWHDAEDYARKIGKRLPTEAEWEKAARGVKGQIYPWGNDFQEGMANIATTEAVPQIREVGSFLFGRSPYGCLDMAGNVLEWMDNWYDQDEDVRALRGGSWYGTTKVRCSARYPNSPDFRGSAVGFRVVRPQSRI